MRVKLSDTEQILIYANHYIAYDLSGVWMSPGAKVVFSMIIQ